MRDHNVQLDNLCQVPAASMKCPHTWLLCHSPPRALAGVPSCMRALCTVCHVLADECDEG